MPRQSLTALLPVLLVPWEAPGGIAPLLSLSGVILLLQALLVALGTKLVWASFCWRSLKRYGCDTSLSQLRKANLRLRAAVLLDVFGLFSQLP